MAALGITSLTANSGKTVISAGLAQYWLNAGKKVGYLRLMPGELQNQTSMEKDAEFLQRILGVNELPVMNVQNKDAEGIKAVFNSAAANKDLMIIEGSLKEVTGLIDSVGGKILIIHDYSYPLEKSIPEYKRINDKLLGVVINKVPRKKVNQIISQAKEELEKSGIASSGVIPEDRILMTLSVADLAEAVQGKILNANDKAGDLVENFMMGSSTFDRTAIYQRKDNKAVLLWGERPGYRKAALSNLQLAALQTSTRCIVVSANGTPIPAVAQKAEEKQVPIISAPGTLQDLINGIEKAFGNLKFHQEKKLPQLAEVLKSSLDFKQLEKALVQ